MVIAKSLKIGELAQQAGVNLQTVRYYERQGLLPKPLRTESGYRQYNEKDLKLLQFIVNAKGFGFSLDKIKNLLFLKANSQAHGYDVKNVITTEIKEIDEKIRSLKELKKCLTELEDSCPGNITITDCPILNALQAS